MGMHMVAATPSGYEPDAGILAKAKEIGAQRGATIQHMTDPRAAVENADVIYTDTWVSMGDEAEKEKRSPVPPSATVFVVQSAALSFAENGLDASAVVPTPRSARFCSAAGVVPVQAEPTHQRMSSRGARRRCSVGPRDSLRHLCGGS